jgi:transcriptional regulator with XRE-family HTH domain
MIGAQCRAGRGLINMTIKELAARAGVATDTIVRFENGDGLHQRTGIAIREALEDAGVVFTDENGGGPGVRLRKAVVK